MSALPHAPRAGDRVSIIVLNWNSGELGEFAVRSALAQEWPDVEVIVVDNASTDDSLRTIEETHRERITIIRNDANLGFGPGMNVGIAATAGSFVLPLNCDAELDPLYASSLVEVMNASPRVGAAGGRVRSDRVGVSGPLAITSTMRTRSLPTDDATLCDKVNGACPLLRRSAVDQIVELFGGPYDPSYAMYGEDVDLALTMSRLGWEYRYEPSAGASHVRSFSSAPRLADRRGPLRVSTLTNRHRNIVRHADHWVLTNLLALAQDVGFGALAVGRGDIDAVRDVVSAWRDHVRHLRNDLDRRRALPPRRPRLITTTSHTADASNKPSGAPDPGGRAR